MVVLVTGSAGHLGEAVLRTLRRMGVPAAGLDRKSSPFTERVGSICDDAFVSDSMRDVSAVVHAATLHKPHLATHSWQDFIFGTARMGEPTQAAAWVTEEVTPRPKNIYGVTKLVAESLCELTHRRHSLPIMILRTARFFPEEDDDAAIRREFITANAQANEMLYRRVDIADAVSAVLAALERALDVRFGRYIISATTPFVPADREPLAQDAPAVVRERFRGCEALFAARGWKLFPTIDRVYVSQRARDELGWHPRYDFRHVLECLASNRDFRSPLALEVGVKGYHDRSFAEGPYPVEERQLGCLIAQER